MTLIERIEQAEAGALRVTRYCIRGTEPGRPGPDFLMVEDRDGHVLLDARMGPDGIFGEMSAEECRDRPWFFTGSPFGEEILALAAALKAKEQSDG